MNLFVFLIPDLVIIRVMQRWSTWTKFDASLLTALAAEVFASNPNSQQEQQKISKIRFFRNRIHIRCSRKERITLNLKRLQENEILGVKQRPQEFKMSWSAVTITESPLLRAKSIAGSPTLSLTWISAWAPTRIVMQSRRSEWTARWTAVRCCWSGVWRFARALRRARTAPG